MAETPVLIFLAGPNGSGKSTFFEQHLAHLGLPYVNADRITIDLQAVNPSTPADEIGSKPLLQPSNFVRRCWRPGCRSVPKPCSPTKLEPS